MIDDQSFSKYIIFKRLEAVHQKQKHYYFTIDSTYLIADLLCLLSPALYLTKNKAIIIFFYCQSNSHLATKQEYIIDYFV